MGAKLKELLGLPSLREAQLMSGQNCLNQTVTCLNLSWIFQIWMIMLLCLRQMNTILASQH